MIDGRFNGMRVIESIYATETVPVRKHKLTRSQITHLQKHMFKGITYHDRIQKKWNKRFGFKQVPGMMIVDPKAMGFMDIGRSESKVIIAHPTVIEALKYGTGDDIKPDRYLTVKYNEMVQSAKERKIRSAVMWKPETDFINFPILRKSYGIVDMDILA